MGITKDFMFLEQELEQITENCEGLRGGVESEFESDLTVMSLKSLLERFRLERVNFEEGTYEKLLFTMFGRILDSQTDESRLDEMHSVMNEWLDSQPEEEWDDHEDLIEGEGWDDEEEDLEEEDDYEQDDDHD